MLLIAPTHGQLDGIYCGKENCYDILDITQEATKTEVVKAYRKLARKWHPDMHKSKADKASAETKFTQIAGAYEILRDEDSRKDYDYMLENPDEYYANYFYYYRRRVTPKVDVRIVIAITITIISAIQYWGAWNNYNSALAYLVTVPKYRIQAMDIAKERGLIGQKKKKDRSKTKEELKEEEEALLKQVLEEKMDIRGGYRKPTLYDVLWVQLVMSPYYIVNYIYFYGRWFWKFTIKGEEYGPDEKDYIIRRNLKMSQGQFDALEDHEKEKFLQRELWVKEKFTVWKKEQEEEAKARLADSSQYKMYRRYMKKGGPGQISFGPD